ncbi:methyl-accepting chemotaxis protein [Blastopirellula marina]|uniref:Methyl-accepting chemotaxis receptor/sensory transducer n=1 Tax=Blastopirellula marina DSM 3645 TaxID=314230 RepID=A3ZZT9_9BACT|nr:PAS domain-containing methyl-accepting chemotaxis protein [Blastopirellula marina]EAQ78049.1 methyl-accepting chemotaxis receptor/sensory transducer [Blastopirellula marina DSM 3645]
MLGMIASRWFTSKGSAPERTESDRERDELQGLAAALDRSSAIIHFSLDGTILSANDNSLQTMGYSRDEIVGKHHRIFVEPQDAASREYSQFWEQLRRGESHSDQFKRIGKGGREVYLQASYNPILDAAGRPTKVVKIATDITQKALSQQEGARAMNMLENLPINIMFADRDLVIRYINHSSRATLETVGHLLPIPVDRILGANIDQFHKNPQHQRQLLANPNNLPVKAKFPLGPEMIDLMVHPIYDDSQNYIGTMASWNIVTQEEALRSQAGQLGQVGQTVASNVNDMAAAMREVSVNVSRTASLAASAEQQVVATDDSIQQLTDSSGQIEEVIDLIRELADQTNLLALNATIEAARAGDAGRSFAVVASEVKSLASETAKATHTIAERVSGIRANIESVVSATREISGSVAEVSQNSTAVAAAIEEQATIISGMKTTAGDLVQLSGQLQQL